VTVDPSVAVSYIPPSTSDFIASPIQFATPYLIGSVCYISWSLNNAQILTDTVQLTFVLSETDSYANRIDWSFVSQSGVPSAFSTVQGSILPNSNNLYYRGLVPTSVSLKVTQTVFSDTIQNVNGTGYMLEFSTTTEGSTVTAQTFQYQSGLQFAFILLKAETTFDILRYPLQTPATFIAGLLGGLSGIMGGIGFFLTLLEAGEKYLLLRKLKKERAATGKKSDLEDELPFASQEHGNKEHEGKKEHHGPQNVEEMLDKLIAIALKELPKLSSPHGEINDKQEHHAKPPAINVQVQTDTHI